MVFLNRLLLVLPFSHPPEKTVSRQNVGKQVKNMRRALRVVMNGK